MVPVETVKEEVVAVQDKPIILSGTLESETTGTARQATPPAETKIRTRRVKKDA
jgi:hypothetical protein